MENNSKSAYEMEHILASSFPKCGFKENGDNFYTIILPNGSCTMVNLNEMKFASPTFSKLTDFIEINEMKLASFEIELPYKSDLIKPLNYLYGVIDNMGNVIGTVINFNTKEEYIVGKYTDNERITNVGIRIHNFNNLLSELSSEEENLYSAKKEEQKRYLKLHEEPIYR